MLCFVISAWLVFGTCTGMNFDLFQHIRLLCVCRYSAVQIGGFVSDLAEEDHKHRSLLGVPRTQLDCVLFIIFCSFFFNHTKDLHFHDPV